MRRPWHILLGVALLGVQAGCSNLPLGAPYRSSEVGKAPPAPRESSKELPSAETARVCIATGDMLFKAGQDREATALYEKARATDGRHAGVCRRLAVLYLRQGQTQKADEEFAKARKMYPKDPNLLNDMGYACYCRGRYAEAEEHFRGAIKLDPENKRAWINLGLTLGQQKHFEESLASFVKAVPEAQAYSNVGFLALAHGDKAAAKEHYRKAVSYDPDLTLARAALDRLEGVQPPSANVAAGPGGKGPSPADSSRLRYSAEVMAQRAADARKAAGKAESGAGAPKADDPLVRPVSHSESENRKHPAPEKGPSKAPKVRPAASAGPDGSPAPSPGAATRPGSLFGRQTADLRTQPVVGKWVPARALPPVAKKSAPAKGGVAAPSPAAKAVNPVEPVAGMILLPTE